MKLHLDIETYSSEDLKTAGIHRYCESVDFEILMVAFAYDDNPVQVIDLAAGEEIPDHIVSAMKDGTTVLSAHNAAFERTAFRAHGIETETSKWECTMVKAAYCGYPLSLGQAAKAMGLEDKKDNEGKALIRYFCVPCKPTKTNGGRVRNFWHHDKEKWEAFKEYCRQDVVVERSIDQRLAAHKIDDTEREMYILDQEINDRGVAIDMDFVRNVIKVDRKNSAKLKAKMKELTGLANPNSQPQLTGWLTEAMGTEVKSLAKGLLDDLISEAGPLAKEVLDLRKRAAKTSVKKYLAMVNSVCNDGRGRGFFQFYGANRTGRWAGRRVQLQNLPRIYMGQEELDTARKIFASGDYDLVDMTYDTISDKLSQLIRTAFIAEEGNILAVADFSAIEARVIAWYASEQWRLDVFNSHGKIYEASASMMFNVPMEEVIKGSDYRAKGKVAELALGYQGSVGALKQMGGEDMGLDEDEMQDIVDLWRAKNPNIKKFWYDLNKAAVAAVQSKRTVILRKYHGLRIGCDNEFMTIQLPSGRKLYYPEAQLYKNRFDQTSVRYKGIDQATRKWGWIGTYGGKLAENIVQATARDVLAVSMLRLRQAGYKIVLHVHDEAVVEMPWSDNIFKRKNTLINIERIMGMPIDWAEGLPLNAEGYLSEYYKKD